MPNNHITLSPLSVKFISTEFCYVCNMYNFTLLKYVIDLTLDHLL